MLDVLCIGNVCYDQSLYLDYYPEENSKSEISDILEAGGGPAANAAFLLAKWGASCAFSGLVGTDFYGEKIADEFKSVSVDISVMEQRQDFVTSFSVILVNRQNGSRTIINRKQPKGQADRTLLQSLRQPPRMMLFDGHELEASLEAIRLFPDAVTVLDAGSLREGTRILAGKVDYLAASERFALAATGLQNFDNEADWANCLDGLARLCGNHIVVTLGERGLIFKDAKGICHLPALDVKALDTTAAGDIFHGAFVYGLLENFTLRESLKLASITAAMSVQVAGGRQSIPGKDDALDYYARNRLLLEIKEI